MEKEIYTVLGVMSGTSLDGIDIAHINFEHSSLWNYEIVAAETIPYPDIWRKHLSEALFYDREKLKIFNEEYTCYLAKVITGFLQRHQLEDLDAVCSHGHTIKHEPENNFTLQIGNLPKLAKLIGQKVVCDFRVQDVEMGGQGAPLVPIGDELLFYKYDFCLNLGGFANVSTNLEGRRIAYDICAVNTVLNHLAEKLGLPYDEGGKIAASGNLDKTLLEKLNHLEFYAQNPPKSLGIEWVNRCVFPLLTKTKALPDVMHTYAVHAATQIANSFDWDARAKVLVTGGGAFNSFLMEQINTRTPHEIIIPAPELINYKEALIFGFLGVLKLRNEINVLKSVTGASKNHSSGKIFLP